MKLTDVIYQITSRYREVENFVRHPFQILEQRGRRAFQERLEQIEIQVNQQQANPAEREVRSQATSVSQPHPSGVAPELLDDRLLQGKATVGVIERIHDPSTLPPLLPEKQELRGRWGRYCRVGEAVQVHSQKRLYNGVLVLNNKPILIQEYLLPQREFNSREVRERLETFGLLNSLNLRQGDSQDFRLVTPWDAIAPTNPEERRCYLITEPISNSLTLRDFLTTHHPSITAKQVRQVLNQVLQTLWFLHNQKMRWPNGEVVQGIPHGNLNLDSLLIVQGSHYSADELQFLIYVADLALWEHLFIPPYRQPSTPSFAQDLRDLGQIGWQLLTGQEFKSADRSARLNGSITTDVHLQDYLKKLTQGYFEKDAEKARNALLQLPLEGVVTEETSATQPGINAEAKDWNKARWLRILLILGLLGGIVGGLTWLTRCWLERNQTIGGDRDRSTPCCLSRVPNVPPGLFTYAVQSDIWRDSLFGHSSVAYGRTLEQELKQRDSRLSQYMAQVMDRDAIAAVQSGEIDFALTEWRDNLPPDLVQQEVAFDGVAVVVAYSDAKRAQNIPEVFQGRIDFDQLRQLYGNQRQWNPPKSLQGWQTKLYLPSDPAAIRLFKYQVLNGGSFKSNLSQMSSNQMFGKILKDFETAQTLGIGFVRLSKVFEQCSVYPLAIARTTQPIQAFIEDTGKPITPATDLCGDKGSYWPNSDVFNTASSPWNYPLVFRLVVVYPKNSRVGERFATALKSDEGQALLAATGLVPVRELNRK